MKGKLLVIKRDEQEKLKVKMEEMELNDERESLETLQSLVGGYIELANFDDLMARKRVDMFCDEEGKMKEGYLPSIIVLNKNQDTILDAVVGNVVFAANDGNGNTIGLCEEQINFVKKRLSEKLRVEIRSTDGSKKFLECYKIVMD